MSRNTPLKNDFTRSLSTTSIGVGVVVFEVVVGVLRSRESLVDLICTQVASQVPSSSTNIVVESSSVSGNGNSNSNVNGNGSTNLEWLLVFLPKSRRKASDIQSAFDWQASSAVTATARRRHAVGWYIMQRSERRPNKIESRDLEVEVAVAAVI